MVTDIDIYRTAKIMMDTYGDGAVLEAMKRQQSFMDLNDRDGAKTWDRVGNAIDWMTIHPDSACGLAVNDC